MKFLIPLALTAIASTAWARIYDELTPAQKNAVQNGDQVVLTTPVAGSDWPEIIVYKRIDATPEEALAVASDYELKSSYTPDMSESKITRHLDRATTEVQYEMKAFLFSIDYTLQNKLSTYAAGASRGYRQDWKMVKGSGKVKDIQGNARFEQLGTGTIMAYTSLIVPNSGSASNFVDHAVSGVRKGTLALVAQIQNERCGNQTLLQKQIQALRAALGR